MGRGPRLFTGEERKAYFEYFAREVLVNLMPGEFYSLQKSDKPDLQDVFGSIGIEVTLALPEGELAAVWDLNEIGGGGCEGGDEKRAEGQGSLNEARRLLIEAAERKIERLNNTGDDEIYEYYEYLHYRLFIFASALTCGEDLSVLMKAVLEGQRDCDRKYEAVYVYSDGFGLWQCDLVDGSVTGYRVTQELKEFIKRRAFELAEGD